MLCPRRFSGDEACFLYALLTCHLPLIAAPPKPELPRDSRRDDRRLTGVYSYNMASDYDSKQLLLLFTSMHARHGGAPSMVEHASSANRHARHGGAPSMVEHAASPSALSQDGYYSYYFYTSRTRTGIMMYPWLTLLLVLLHSHPLKCHLKLKLCPHAFCSLTSSALGSPPDASALGLPFRR